MKKIILIGRSECGKTTLRQALKGDTIHYHKTQYVNHYDVVIDTPGEYAETNTLGRALALYSFEADVVGLLIGAGEPYSLYPPCVTASSARPVIGIVTQIDTPWGDPDQAERWLRLAGCETVFRVSSYTGEGIWEILEYLREEGDELPWDQEDAGMPRTIVSTKSDQNLKNETAAKQVIYLLCSRFVFYVQMNNFRKITNHSSMRNVFEGMVNDGGI